MSYRIRKSIISWILSTKFIIGIFIGLVGYLIYLNDWINLFRSSNLPCNIFEPYIYSATDKWAVNASIGGLLFAISDIPFIDSKEGYCIYRTTKLVWLVEKIYFLCVSVLIYCFGISLIMIAFSAPLSYITNQWSDLMSILAGSPIGKMYFNNTYIISNLTPLECFGICCLLNFLYMLMLSFIAFGMSFFKGKAVAFSVVLFFQALQYYLTIILRKTYFFSCFKNTLVVYCTQYISKDILQAVIFDLIIIISMIFLLMINKNKVEYWMKG